MDLDAIPTAEFALGEAILPPSHYGTDEPELDDDDPQPEPCVECDGSGRSQISTRGHVVPINCPHCHGEGVTEP